MTLKRSRPFLFALLSTAAALACAAPPAAPLLDASDPVVQSFLRMLSYAPFTAQRPALPSQDTDPLQAALVEPLRQQARGRTAPASAPAPGCTAVPIAR